MQTKRFEALDGWRGIAALAIAFYHVPIAHPLREWARFKNMELFVDLFFVLSGFVMMHAWGSRLAGVETGRRFMLKRFFRVFPLHVAILFGFFAFELARYGAGFVMRVPGEGAPFADDRSLAALISNILMLQSLGLHGTTTWNGPAWSISVEFWTYLIFAAAMIFGRGRIWLLAALAGLGFAGIALLSPIFLFATHDYGLFRAVFGFFVGALAYRLHAGTPGAAPAGTVVELALVGAMLGWLTLTGLDASSLLTPFVFAALILGFANGRGLVTRLLENGAVQALGRWSYSIYLVHALLFYGLRLALVMAEKALGKTLTVAGAGSERIFSLGAGWADGLAILALLALTICVSKWSYRLIEQPYMAGLPGLRRGARPERIGLALR